MLIFIEGFLLASHSCKQHLCPIEPLSSLYRGGNRGAEGVSTLSIVIELVNSWDSNPGIVPPKPVLLGPALKLSQQRLLSSVEPRGFGELRLIL